MTGLFWNRRRGQKFGTKRYIYYLNTSGELCAPELSKVNPGVDLQNQGVIPRRFKWNFFSDEITEHPMKDGHTDITVEIVKKINNISL